MSFLMMYVPGAGGEDPAARREPDPGGDFPAAPEAEAPRRVVIPARGARCGRETDLVFEQVLPAGAAWRRDAP